MQKKFLVLMVIVAAAALASSQEGLQTHATTEVLGTKQVVQGPTYEDVYCAGYITTQPPQELGYVSGNWNSPHEATTGTHKTIYLHGTGLEVGREYEIIRHVRDLNHARVYKGQREALRAAGETYFEIGSVKVIEVRGPMAITDVSFSCDGIHPGDIAVAMPKRDIPLYHGPMTFDRFAPPNGRTTGHIIMARDYDWTIGARSQVMLDLGTEKGIKVGDYFRITRTYDHTAKDEVDRISMGGRDMVDTDAVNPRQVTTMSLNELPRRSVGEMVVTNVTPRSATGVVTFALEEMFLGDVVEAIDVPPPPAADAGPQPMPPSLACNAVPSTVRVGDTSNITCDPTSPDNRPMTMAFTTDRGTISPRENNAMLSTRDAGAGPITVTATVTDDRNLSASANVVVNVEAGAAAPQASLAGEAMFKQ